MQGYTRTATFGDVWPIASNMRQADMDEVKAGSGRNPVAALNAALNVHGNVTKAICLPNDYPVGMYGTVPSGAPGVGIIWMLASNYIKPLHRQFLRESRERINEVSQGYNLIYNFTDARNHVHHRWIDWAGFTIIKRHEQFGKEERPFLEFVRIMES